MASVWLLEIHGPDGEMVVFAVYATADAARKQMEHMIRVSAQLRFAPEVRYVCRERQVH